MTTLIATKLLNVDLAKIISVDLLSDGAPARSRTADLLITNQDSIVK